MFFENRLRGCLCDVLSNILDYDNEVSKFEPMSPFEAHFRSHILAKEHPYPLSSRLNSTSTVLL